VTISTAIFFVALFIKRAINFSYFNKQFSMHYF
jgi:hypothetical protein